MMLQNDITKLIDSVQYLVDHEQYDLLATQLEFSIHVLLEDRHIDAIVSLFEIAFPILLEQHNVNVIRQLLELVLPTVSKDDAFLYAKLLYCFGHVYFLIEERTQAIAYYRQSLSYFMKCDPVPFANMSIALLNLAVLTENETSYDTQLSYARVISTFKSIDTASETPKDILNKYSFYYETCLRLERFEDAFAVLTQWQALSFTPLSREELQVHAFEVLYYYKQQQYDKALCYVTAILARFSHYHNMTIMLAMYTIAIDCHNALQQPQHARKLQQQHDALKKHLQRQRMEVNEKFPLPTHTLRNSTPLPTMSAAVNELLQQPNRCYTIIVYDISTFAHDEQTDMLQQLHQQQLAVFGDQIAYFTAIKHHQCVYVVACDEQHIDAHIQRVVAALPFEPTYGYCHSSKHAIRTFEQLLHMSYAYIYYSYSQKRKVT